MIIDEEELNSLLFSNSYYHVFGVCCEQTGISCLSVLHSILYFFFFFWLLIDRSITKNSVPCVEIRFDYLLLVVIVQYT